MGLRVMRLRKRQKETRNLFGENRGKGDDGLKTQSRRSNGQGDEWWVSKSG